MNDALYRDAAEPIRREIAAKITTRRRELVDAAARRRLYAARVGRSAGGAAMVATILVGGPLLAVLGRPASADKDVLTMVLLSSWAIGLVVRQLAYLLAGWRFGRWLAGLPRVLDACATDPDPLRALARLDATPSPAAAVHRRIDRWQTAALALPMVACSLAAPLTLHYLFVLGCDAIGALAPGHGSSFSEIRSFDEWISVSAVVVGHAHLVLAGHALLFARRLRRLPAGAAPPEGAGWSALLWAVCASGVPGALLIFVPPVLTFLTGLAFIPLMYGAASRAFVRERAALQ
jgi:hypothetical protein